MTGEEDVVDAILAGEQTVEDVTEQLNPEDAYAVFNNGITDMEIDHDTETVTIERSGLEQVNQGDTKALQYQKRESIGKLLIPVDIIAHDAPYVIGKKTAGISTGSDTESKVGHLIGNVATVGAVCAFIYDIGSELLMDAEGLHDSYYPFAVGAISAGNAFHGRAAGIREERYEHYLSELTNEAGHYTVEPY